MPSLKQMIPRWVKKSFRSLMWQYWRATWRRRSLPDFIIIGAQKSGTSSLYSYLFQHPQVLPSFGKEVHFFDGGLNPNIDNFKKGHAWYRAHFPLKKKLGSHSKTFEASPLYIFNPLTPKRIFDLIPQVKIIALLRNPTERAISHYFHEKRKGRESLPIMEALQKEEERLHSVLENKDYKNTIFIRYSYKSRGLYRQQLDRFLTYFPRSQILVLSSEEFFGKPAATLKQVFEFVGVDTGFKIKDLRPRNVASNKSRVDPDVYKYLNNFFLPHNQALYQLVGNNFSW
ncbi:MAG: sulfotransferase domain-containing protein [Spirochaetales bacterium]|nr:sulfotransferase domain-containing protein [Spirochaetales bacterium]